MSLRASIIAALLLCSGCAIIPEQVEVNYQPDASVSRVALGAPAPIQVTVTDARKAESPAWIADKKNGYGMRLASVNAQRPVSDLVRDAITEELRARGITVGESHTVLAIDITRLESVYQNRFFSIGAIGYGDWSVQVRRLDGTILYARTLSVSNDEEAGLAGTAGQARRSIELVMTKIIGQLLADPAFTKALSASQLAA